MVKMEDCCIIQEYIKCVLPLLTEVVGCERKEYAFIVLPEYDIIICMHACQCWLSHESI